MGLQRGGQPYRNRAPVDATTGGRVTLNVHRARAIGLRDVYLHGCLNHCVVLISAPARKGRACRRPSAQLVGDYHCPGCDGEKQHNELRIVGTYDNGHKQKSHHTHSVSKHTFVGGMPRSYPCNWTSPSR